MTKPETTDRVRVVGDGPPVMVQAPLKLLQEAHAVMRACGWQLAPAADNSEDPTLALAAAEIEEAFGEMLGVSHG